MEKRLAKRETLKIRRKTYNEHLRIAKKIRAMQARGDSGTALMADYVALPDPDWMCRTESGRRMASRFMPFIIMVGIKNGVPEKPTVPALPPEWKGYVSIVEEADILPIEKTSGTAWKQMGEQKKAGLFRYLMKQYRSFDAFMWDLPWMNFMKAYGLTKQTFRDMKERQEMARDLAGVWETVQKAS